MGSHEVSRRAFLHGLAAGGLLVAVAPLVAGADKTITTVPTQLAGWIRIGRDGAATLLSNTSEIGQGTGTAIAQMLAEELDLDWNSVRIEAAPIESAYFNPQWQDYATYGSGGVAGQFVPLRKAGAQARAVLVAAAAARWQIPAEQCETESGHVRHRATGRSLGYGDLAAQAAQLPLPAEPALKEKTRWTLIGHDAPRLDIEQKLDGSAVFGIDVSMPGLLVATIRQAPRFGGRLASVDPAPALAITGVRKVVSLEHAVAVVATGYWPAKKALATLSPVWDFSAAASTDSAEYEKALVAAVETGGTVYPPRASSAEASQAAYDAAQRTAASNTSATYTFPLLAHATMEPMNGTARVDASSAELWLPTQTPAATRAAVAKKLGLPVERVTMHVTLAGGGFGRRIEFDFALQAAEIARAAGSAVKLVWSREEDLAHDYYRPATAVKLTASLDASGVPVAWQFATAGASLLEYSMDGMLKAMQKPVDPSGMGEPPKMYQLGPRLYRVTTMDAGVPVGYWRSVAASQNSFAYETFLDQLAHDANLDPLAYRLHLLTPDGREQRTLNACAGLAGWNTPLPANRHRGLAFVHANGSHIAEIVELSLDAQKRVQIHRVCVAMDCGVAINPRNIRAQVEGSIAFALSAAFSGAITLKNGVVEQTNFYDYPLIGIAAMPPVEVVILEGGDVPGGVGEEAVSPLAPALANALSSATGQRIRSLPLARSGFSLAPSRA